MRIPIANGETNTASRQCKLDERAPVGLWIFAVLISTKTWPRNSARPVGARARLDNASEPPVAGYSLPHAMMMLIPEAWSGHAEMEPKRRAFYEYYAALMEPWDAPAAIAFTDGRQIRATLDRNGLRPARFCVTDDIIMASKSGALPLAEKNIIRKWRQPGRTPSTSKRAEFVEDEEIKSRLAAEQPYGDWLRETQFKLEELPPPPEAGVSEREPDALKRTRCWPLDTPRRISNSCADGCCGRHPVVYGRRYAGSRTVRSAKLLYDYFKQNFATELRSADRPDPRGDGDEPCPR